MVMVSVIIPAFNYGRYLGSALESILAQTYEDFEIIIVDDGSTDNTLEVVRGFTDPRIKYIYQENKGLPGARNTGIKAAQGKYIAFLDADDLWHPCKLEKQVSFLERNDNVGVVYTGASYVNTEGELLPFRWDPEPKSDSFYEALLFQNPIHVSSATVRADCLAQIGLFDESFMAVEDLDLWRRIAARYSFYQISENLTIARHHPENMTKDLNRMAKGWSSYMAKALRETPPRHGKALQQAKLHVYWEISRLYLDMAFQECAAGNTGAAKESLRQAHHYHPWLHRVDALLVLLEAAIGTKGMIWLWRIIRSLQHWPVGDSALPGQ
jgi:glycosyltransferase involved in cell wall biosynthesis